MKRLAAVLLITIIISLSSCAGIRGNTDIPGTNTDQSSYTPAQIINLYCESLKSGDLNRLNSLFSEEWIAKYGLYKKLNPQNIYNIKIRKEDNAEADTENDQKVRYSVTFTIKDGDFFFGQLTPGEENYFFFVDMVKENNVWKINGMSTGP